jgi:hypothetical protein
VPTQKTFLLSISSLVITLLLKSSPTKKLIKFFPSYLDTPSPVCNQKIPFESSIIPVTLSDGNPSFVVKYFKFLPSYLAIPLPFVPNHKFPLESSKILVTYSPI